MLRRRLVKALDRGRDLGHVLVHLEQQRLVQLIYVAARGGDVLLLSVHSFTPVLGDEIRPMEMGVLFDRFDSVAHRLASHLREQGFVTALNEPYDGKDGAIYSAGRHGCRHGVIYLEIEIRQDIIDTPEKVADVASRLAQAVDVLQIRTTPRSPSKTPVAAD